jgi:hypothetical protein
MSDVSGVGAGNESIIEKTSPSRSLVTFTIVIVALAAVLTVIEGIITDFPTGAGPTILAARALGGIVFTILMPAVIFVLLCIFRRYRNGKALVRTYLIVGICILVAQLVNIIKAIGG